MWKIRKIGELPFYYFLFQFHFVRQVLILNIYVTKESILQEINRSVSPEIKEAKISKVSAFKSYKQANKQNLPVRDQSV